MIGGGGDDERGRIGRSYNLIRPYHKAAVRSKEFYQEFYQNGFFYFKNIRCFIYCRYVNAKLNKIPSCRILSIICRVCYLFHLKFRFLLVVKIGVIFYIVAAISKLHVLTDGCHWTTKLVDDKSKSLCTNKTLSKTTETKAEKQYWEHWFSHTLVILDRPMYSKTVKIRTIKAVSCNTENMIYSSCYSIVSDSCERYGLNNFSMLKAVITNNNTILNRLRVGLIDKLLINITHYWWKVFQK